MRRTSLLLAALALVISFAPSARAIELVDLILLKNEGKTDAEVVEKARAGGLAFELTTENMRRLKRAGMSDEAILNLARIKLREVSPTAPAPMPAPTPAPVPEPFKPPIVPTPAPGRPPTLEPPPPQPECAACKTTGLVPCPRHPATVARGRSRFPLLHESTSDVPICCKGTGLSLCPKCKSKSGELALAALIESVKLRRTGWTDFDRVVAGEGGGGRPYHVETPHLGLAADVSPREAHQLAAACESLLATLRTRFGDAFDFTTPADTQFYVAKDLVRYGRFLDALGEHVKFKPSLMAHAKTTGAAVTFYHPISVATCVHGRKLSDDQHFMCHQFGHILLNRFDRYRRMPMWLSEGFADECERLVTNSVHVYCFDYDPKELDLKGDWTANVRKLIQTGKVSSWRKIFGKEAMDMSAQDYQQSWSMVRFLMDANPAKFLDFVRELKRTDDPVEDAFEKAYGLKLDTVEKSWRTWAGQAR